LKPNLNMMNGTSPGPIFCVDSGSEVGILIFHLCEVLHPYLYLKCTTRNYPAIANASTNKITSSVVRSLSHIPRAWVKIVYIKPFSVGVGRDTITMDSGFGTVTLIQKEMVVVMII